MRERISMRMAAVQTVWEGGSDHRVQGLESVTSDLRRRGWGGGVLGH